MNNDVIKKLAIQAGVDTGQLFAEMLCNDGDVNAKIAEAWNAQPAELRQRIFQVIEHNQEKFAELIVKECRTVALSAYKPILEVHGNRETDYYIAHNNGILLSLFAIECHFGIKE